MKRLGLRSEIVLQLGLLMAAAMIFCSVLIMKFYEQEMLQQQVEASITQLQLLASRIPTDPTEDLPLNLRNVFGNTALTGIVLQQGDSALINLADNTLPDWVDRGVLRQAAVSGQYDVKLIADDSVLGWQIPQQLQVTIPLRDGIVHYGSLQARFSLRALAAKVSHVQDLVLLIVILFGLILTLFGSYLLGKNVVRPITALESASLKVADGDLDTHLPVSGPQTLANLARSFNSMTDALRNSRHDTDAHIAELEHLNQQLHQTRDTLVQSEKMASIGHLAAGMAHEIGNPLGALIGYLDLLHKQAASTEKDLVAAAQAETERIDVLVRDLLDYAKPETGQGAIVDARELIAASVKIMQQQGVLNNSRLKLELAITPQPVCIAANRLQQVMINLLQNAIDASTPDAIIHLASETSRHFVRICVTNRGPQIPAATITSLFDPFFTTKGPDKGRGLGLFVCHNIIAAANGRIEVQSTPAGLTSFTVLLPYIGDSNAET